MQYIKIKTAHLSHNNPAAGPDPSERGEGSYDPEGCTGTKGA